MKEGPERRWPAGRVGERAREAVSQAEGSEFTGRATVLYDFETTSSRGWKSDHRRRSAEPVTHYAHGKTTRKEHDTKLAGRFDLISYFEDGVLTRQEALTSCPDRPDLWVYYQDGSESARTSQDGDGVADVRYLREGSVVRREGK